MGLCLPLVANEGPYPGRESGGIVSGNFPDSFIPLGDECATILRGWNRHDSFSPLWVTNESYPLRDWLQPLSLNRWHFHYQLVSQ